VIVPKERNLHQEIDMTKYEIARLKRAIKRDLTKSVLSPRAKNTVIQKERLELPDYVKNNPWY
jgi:hypothetical protein